MGVVCTEFRGAHGPCLGTFRGPRSSWPPNWGLWALLSPLGTGAACLSPPWHPPCHPPGPFGPPGCQTKVITRRKSHRHSLHVSFFKLSIFLAAQTAIQVCHLSPFGAVGAFSVRVTRAGAPAQSRCHALLCPFAIRETIPPSPPCSISSQKHLLFLLHTFRLGKSLEPVSCRWLVKELFLFTELPQSWRASTCKLFANTFCQYAFIRWLPCLKMILCVFHYCLDVFLSVSKVLPLSNRPSYLPDF